MPKCVRFTWQVNTTLSRPPPLNYSLAALTLARPHQRLLRSWRRRRRRRLALWPRGKDAPASLFCGRGGALLVSLAYGLLAELDACVLVVVYPPTIMKFGARLNSRTRSLVCRPRLQPAAAHCQCASARKRPLARSLACSKCKLTVPADGGDDCGRGGALFRTHSCGRRSTSSSLDAAKPTPTPTSAWTRTQIGAERTRARASKSNIETAPERRASGAQSHRPNLPTLAGPLRTCPATFARSLARSLSLCLSVPWRVALVSADSRPIRRTRPTSALTSLLAVIGANRTVALSSSSSLAAPPPPPPICARF